MSAEEPLVAHPVRPGDSIIIGLARDDLPLDEAERIRDQIHAHFPTNEIIIIAGATVAVKRAEAEG